ncbi:MAG TPA: hypothetical protein VMW50_10220 [Dehalococcoidia bacterium]|nr:hypothetical protein [Dehalococcoidia bacterium]
MYELVNKKLAEWAGFVDTHRKFSSQSSYRGDAWLHPDGNEKPLPNFTESLDACFKWLVPNIRYSLAKRIDNRHESWVNELGHDILTYYAVADTPALALCLAIEKLIDKEGK